RPAARRPGPGEPGRRAAAAARVRTPGTVPVGRLLPPEPLRVRVRYAERDREVAFPPRIDVGDAEVGAARGVGVLVVERVRVGGGEDPPAGPVAAHPLPLDGAQPIGREGPPVLLVRLVDGASRVVAPAGGG